MHGPSNAKRTEAVASTLQRILKERGWTHRNAVERLQRFAGFRELNLRTFYRWVNGKNASLRAVEAVDLLSAMEVHGSPMAIADPVTALATLRPILTHLRSQHARMLEELKEQDATLVSLEGTVSYLETTIAKPTK